MYHLHSLIGSRRKAAAQRAREDRGDIAQKVVLIAGFIMVAMVLVMWLSTASSNKAADAARCTQDSKTLTYQGRAIHDANAAKGLVTGNKVMDNRNDRFACGQAGNNHAAGLYKGMAITDYADHGGGYNSYSFSGKSQEGATFRSQATYASTFPDYAYDHYGYEITGMWP